MSLIFRKTYPRTLLLLLDSTVMQITHCIFLLPPLWLISMPPCIFFVVFCNRLKWIMPACPWALLLCWDEQVVEKLFQRGSIEQFLRFSFVCVWNTPKMDEQENPSLSTDCKLPTRLKKNPYLWDLKILICGGLGSPDIAVVHLWYTGSTCATEHTLSLVIREEMWCNVHKIWWIGFSLSSRWLLASLEAFTGHLVVAE